MTGTEGRIFKIKRFSVHDGPGIRTAVFLKGCPLRCVWCHSPEGIGPDISIWFNPNACISCGRCVKACPEGALSMNSGIVANIEIDRLKCQVTGDCVNVCPTNAMQFTGMVTSPDEVFREIEKDIAFYHSSGGGVTLTGGEPLFQPDFAFEILDLCRRKQIHTAIEISLFAEKEVIKRIIPVTDLVIADLKISDPFIHKLYTGESNEIIKENFSFLTGSGKSIIVRVPKVKNITDTMKNTIAIQEFVNSFRKKIPIEFIEFNPLAINNYKRLGIPFPLATAAPVDRLLPE
jgi:pyruvate formate lyase activating enzyme